MICPYCNCYESKVVKIKHVDKDRSTRRRRECDHCRKRYSTSETVRIKEKKNDSRFEKAGS